MILALDIGTSSVRASLYNESAEPVRGASVKVEHSLVVSGSGVAEIDADGCLAQLIEAIDQLGEKLAKRPHPISHVATSCFWHSLVGIDANGKPTTKVFSWADTRSRKYTEVLRKKFDEATVHNRTGARFHSSFWPAKLLWLRHERPDAWATTARWLSFSDYAAMKLVGDAGTSVSIASGTGIFDQRKCDWDDELLRYLKVTREKLPVIPEADDEPRKLSNKFAKRWPWLADSLWFPAIADGAADNLGSGCISRTKAALMIGTSGAMRVAYEGEPPAAIPSGLWSYRIDREKVIIGGALSDGGNLYAWMKKNLDLPKDAEEQIAKRPLGAHGVTVSPYFHGERSTLYREDARGAIDCLTASNDAIDILQAAMEGVAYRFAEILKQLNSVVKVREIVASGGALRDSPVWTRMISDILGRNLTMNTARESSSRGAVLLALESIGKIDKIG